MTALDPARTALEEERDLLLRSLDDLDAEHEAGDLSDDDYETLRDTYTSRAADVLRRLGEGPAPAAVSTTEAGPRRTKRLGLLVALVLFAGVAGFALARSVGERGAGQSPTGGTDPGARTRVLECENKGSSGALLDSLKCFDEILKDDPQNAEALAYRGWYLALAAFQIRDSATDDQQKAQAQELIQTGLTYLDRAVQADPALPDPLAFRAVVHDRLGQGAQSCDDIRRLLALNPPEFFKTQTSAMAQRNNC